MNNGDLGCPRGRGRGFKQPESQPRELRRPRNVGDDVRAPEVPKSTLSAEAKEWYPPNYVPQQPAYQEPAYNQNYRYRSSVQDRLRQAQDQTEVYNFDEMSYSLEEAEGNDLRESITGLIAVMCEITLNPGKFDTLCGPLVDTFASTLLDLNYTRALVDAIFTQSICEANFRYNGARLCSMYDSVAPPEESTFRACLLERCSVEENRIISGFETNEENVRGFAMFLAEIYTQLEDNQGGRIRSLGASLCKVLMHLLDTDKETNIKSVCQLLKLSGIALDADCPGGMAAACERLARRAEMPAVSAVLALRASRWGLADPHCTLNGETSSASTSDGGFLADGHALTAEERAFLQNNIPSAELEADILDELENDAWDTGMDAEMQAGFLEFLKMSNQIKR